MLPVSDEQFQAVLQRLSQVESELGALRTGSATAHEMALGGPFVLGWLSAAPTARGSDGEVRLSRTAGPVYAIHVWNAEDADWVEVALT
jgi:hypothetical protein